MNLKAIAIIHRMKRLFIAHGNGDNSDLILSLLDCVTI